MLAGKVAVVAGYGDVGKGVRTVRSVKSLCTQDLLAVLGVPPIIWCSSLDHRDRPY